MSSGFAFGPYRLALRPPQLVREDAPIALSDHQFALLHALVSKSGEVLTKDLLIKAVWKDVAVDDGSLTQLVFHVRRLLDAADPERYIASVRRVGYRFAVPVTRVDARRTQEEIAALLDPHRAIGEGRAAIETLDPSGIARARATFEPLVALHPDEAKIHAGLAAAAALRFESTRADPAPDMEALRVAAEHALDACRLNPDYAEGWASYGFVLDRMGRRADALAGLRRAVALEPDNWRHHLRLSFVDWGEGRLRAARRRLQLIPECPPARLLAATVFVARDALDLAGRELDHALPGFGSADRPNASGRFPGVGLHWLKGLLCFAHGRDDQAVSLLERELALDEGGPLYGREMAANAWYALGAVRLRRGDRHAARDAFDRALACVPDHRMARTGLSLLELNGGGGKVQVPDAPLTPLTVETATARAAQLVAVGQFEDAARLVGDALMQAPPGSAGWLLPVEPLLGVQTNRAAWSRALATLSARAA